MQTGKQSRDYIQRQQEAVVQSAEDTALAHSPEGLVASLQRTIESLESKLSEARRLALQEAAQLVEKAWTARTPKGMADEVRALANAAPAKAEPEKPDSPTRSSP